MLAPAKINLHLDILRRRGDGFHDLETVFAAVSLADELRIEEVHPRTAGEPLIARFEVSGPYAAHAPAGPGNLVVRALEAMDAAVRLPALEVSLVKNIPAGAGLGGGSSDAATALRLANALAAKPLGEKHLHAIAAKLGSDCAFFLRGGAARGTGRGEVLEPIPNRRSFHLLIVWPHRGVSTKEAYGALRPEHLGARTDSAAVAQWLAGERDVLPALYNSFEAALDAQRPDLAELRRALLDAGALAARLSGSGSATFGIFDSETAARKAVDAVAAFGDCFVCVPVVN